MFTLQGYIAIQRDRKVGRGGGIVTFIKQNLGYNVVEKSQDLEIVMGGA